MQKNILFAILGIFVLLFGCVTIEVNHKQNADGSAVVTQTLFLEEYVSSISSFGGEDAQLPSEEEFNQMCEGTPSDVECTTDYEKWTMTLTKEFTSENAYYEFEVQEDLFTKKYKLTVDYLPEFGEIGNGEDEVPAGKLSDSDAEEVSYLASAGVVYTYEVEMPGTITSAENGIVDGNTVIFDVMNQMEEQKPIVVESEESNLLLFVGIGALIIILLAVVLFFFGRSKN